MSLPLHPADHHVVVLGASPKPRRYANQAVRLLKQHGYRITPIHPRFECIEELDVIHHLSDVSEKIHTLTLYVGPDTLEPQIEHMVNTAPERVIFNPGTKSVPAQQALTEAGIHWIEACTLILLRNNQF